HLLDLHRAPEVDELDAARRTLARGAGHVAGVDRSHRRAAQDLELRVAPDPLRKLLDEVADDAGLVGAARTAAREHERTPRTARARIQIDAVSSGNQGSVPSSASDPEATVR